MSTWNVLGPVGRSRPGHLVALLTATAVAASLLSAPPGAAVANPGPPVDVAGLLAPAGAEPVAVTLITGDTVWWQDGGEANSHLVEITQAPRDYPVTFDRAGTPDEFYVIPSDAMAYVVAGQLDAELFNIPGLIRQGLDDTASDELPVIVTFERDRSPAELAGDADALPATASAVAVQRINGAGVAVDRRHASAFRTALLDQPGTAAAAGGSVLGGGVERVWLDRMLQIDLADSVPQIGAPQAWAAGFTGEGVTVAVLDTGVDTSHPDLAGQVAAMANFTGEPDGADTNGHGTHVASTIAGTGAASGGARAGVAPGARLLSGKVCDAGGQCPLSSIMAGMEWAAAQGADIVNMSLGGAPSDGTDPLSELVNELSAETGALFVISAGNTRVGLRVVGSPGAADAALTVGAVDKLDRRASFSSRGPRLGDHAVKPEITAPGVDIVAARAAGTTPGVPVDEHYTSLNGTSMASPHVAGAAALLAQARPDLSGPGLKDALVSTAADGGRRWFEQGTGRVEVPPALTSPVHATGTVNFGGVDGQATRQVVYTNHSGADIPLTLHAAATDLNGQPFNGLTLSVDSITVPAHGSTAVDLTVTLDTSQVNAQTSYGGTVTATGPEVDLRTAIGFGPRLHRVSIEILDSHGQPVGSDTADDARVWITNDTLDRQIGGTEVHQVPTDAGVATGHLPTGTYSIFTHVLEHEPDAEVGELTRLATLVEVELDITGETTITLDARDAQPVGVSVPRKAEKRNLVITVARELPGAGGRPFLHEAMGGNAPVYLTSATAGELAPVSLLVSWTLAEPQEKRPVPWDTTNFCRIVQHWCYTDTPAYIYNLPVLYENGIPDDLHMTITRADLIEVPTRFHADDPEEIIEQRFVPILPSVPGFDLLGRLIYFTPGMVTEYYLAHDRLSWQRIAGWSRPHLSLFFPQVSWDRFPSAEAGSRRPVEHWNEGPPQVGIWDLREEAADNPFQLNTPATGSRNGREGEWFVVPSNLIDNQRGHGASGSGLATWRMWNLDTGAELPRTGISFPLSPGTATYRLDQEVDFASLTPLLSQHETTTWTFTSHPSDALVPEHYQCVIQQAPRQDICQIQPLIHLQYQLGLDISNRAPAGRAHQLTITAGHHSKAVHRAPVTTMTVQASFDGGATWHDAEVIGQPRDTWETGGYLPSAGPNQRFHIVVDIPPLHHTDGSVTLRVRAQDANGGTVDQTIRHAYRLK